MAGKPETTAQLMRALGHGGWVTIHRSRKTVELATLERNKFSLLFLFGFSGLFLDFYTFLCFKCLNSGTRISRTRKKNSKKGWDIISVGSLQFSLTRYGPFSPHARFCVAFHACSCGAAGGVCSQLHDRHWL